MDQAADETVDDLFGSAINSIIEWRQNLECQPVKQPQSKKSHASQAQPSPADRDGSLEAKLSEALKKLCAEKVGPQLIRVVLNFLWRLQGDE